VKTRIGVGRRAASVSIAMAVAVAWSWVLIGSASAANAPDVTLAKVSDASGPLEPGEGFSYTLTVNNVGTATAHGIEVQDDLPLGVHVTTLVPTFPQGQCTVTSSAGTGRPEHWSVTCTRASLAAGASASVTFGVTLTGDVRCGSLTNTASVSASDEPAAAQGDDSASASDTVTCPPSIEMTKTAPRFTHVGTAVRFTMHVTNSGEVDLDHVTVSDPGCDGAPHGGGDGTLSPGEHRTYRCRHVVRTSTPDLFATTATVRAASAGGSTSARARATTRVLKPKLSISVVPNPVSATVGDTLTYRYVIRNTGNATLTDVAITDDQLGSVGTVPQLAPGHRITFQVHRTVTAERVWVTNTATVTAKDASGHGVRSRDRAAVTIVAASTHAGGTNASGDGTAFTGGDATVPGLVALVLVVVGATALLLGARRRS
jgi:uncharacterized repeat protein (TIGR01451 family)